MTEQEITNNKIEKIFTILSGELSTALTLAEGDTSFLLETANDESLTKLVAKYHEMEFKEALSQNTNGFPAFLNAMIVTRQLLTILRIPNTINSELICERTTYYINGLYAAYKEEKNRVVDPKKMDYHLMATFSEYCIQNEWIALETYRKEAETMFRSKKSMCDYITEKYKNRKEKVKIYEKQGKVF